MPARLGRVLVVLAALFAAVVATRPAEFAVTRSWVMAAPPALAFAQLDAVTVTQAQPGR